MEMKRIHKPGPLGNLGHQVRRADREPRWGLHDRSGIPQLRRALRRGLPKDRIELFNRKHSGIFAVIFQTKLCIFTIV